MANDLWNSLSKEEQAKHLKLISNSLKGVVPFTYMGIDMATKPKSKAPIRIAVEVEDTDIEITYSRHELPVAIRAAVELSKNDSGKRVMLTTFQVQEDGSIEVKSRWIYIGGIRAKTRDALVKFKSRLLAMEI